MAQLSITLQVHHRWWLGPALKLLLVVHQVTGWAPSTNTIRRLTTLGVRCTVGP